MPPRNQFILYDLDQTIIPWDTQLVFRSYILRKEPLRRPLTLIFLLFLPLYKILGTGGMKRVFHSYLWRMPLEDLENHADAFVRDWLPQIIYPEIVAKISQQKEQNQLLVLSSASPELWVARIGNALGFESSFGTRFDWQAKQRLFPDLIGENHKGPEKVRRLTQAGISQAEAGYTDSKADLPLLQLCRLKNLVNPLPRFRQMGENHQWTILTPPTPWKNRFYFSLESLKQLLGIWKP